MIRETINYSFLLPHPQNELNVDVHRLRESLIKIDALLKEINTTVTETLESKAAENAETLQSKLNEINALVNGMQQSIQQSAENTRKTLNKLIDEKMAEINSRVESVKSLKALIFAGL